MSRCRDCGATLPESCNCILQEADGVDVAGDGSSGSPYVPTVEVAAGANLVTADTDGLDGRFPERVYSPPRIRVKCSRTFVSDGAAGTTLTWQAPAEDPYGFFNAAQPTRLTVPFEAIWGIGAILAFATSNVSAFTWEQLIFLNGGVNPTATRSRTHPTLAGLGTWFDCLTVYHEEVLSAGEYATINARVTTGGAGFIDTAEDVTPEFYMTYLGDV